MLERAIYMLKVEKVSKTLMTATAVATLMLATASVPGLAELTGHTVIAQQLGVSSQAEADRRAAARAARPKLSSVQSPRERQGKILVRAQEMLSAEPPRVAEAKEILVDQDIGRWIEPELVGYHQIMASVSQTEGNMDGLLEHYKELLKFKNIPYSLRDQVTYAVGQIEFSNDNREEGKKYLYEWLQYQPTPNISHLEFFTNVHFAIGQSEGISAEDAAFNYRLAIEYLNWAIRKTKEEGKQDKENWYAVLRTLHSALEEQDKVLEYAELLATRWPKKEYWLQLSGIYGQSASEPVLTPQQIAVLEKKQFAAYELAHRQNLLDNGREMESMSQLYLYHESPYQSSKVITSAIDQGISEKNLRNLQLQANAFIAGKDYEKAVDPMKTAAELSEDGDNYMRLANIYLTLDKYEEAAAAIESALNKGGLRRPDQSSILQGQAYLALENFAKARDSFRAAINTADDERTEKIARDMLRYVDSEEKRIADIREYLS